MPPLLHERKAVQGLVRRQRGMPSRRQICAKSGPFSERTAMLKLFRLMYASLARRRGAGFIGMVGALAQPKQRFQLVLIKPSHYDADRHLIPWVRAVVPSNTPAGLYNPGRGSGPRGGGGPRTPPTHAGSG